MKILRVGDPHVRHNNIDESDRLFEFVVEVALAQKVDRIEILGDLFHTHSIVRLEVLDFWNHWLDHLSDVCEVVVLVGNHDQSGRDDVAFNALSIFQRLRKKNLRIIEFGTVLSPFAYMPYEGNKERFIEVVNGMADNYGATFLVCHQTVEGSKYDNGIFAPDGVDPKAISPKYVGVLSGHIHTEQEFDRFTYPGTPRWDSVSDANKRKGITLYYHEDSTGKITGREFFSTERVCSPIVEYSWKEGEEAPVIPENARVSIELIGTSDWVAAKKATLKGHVKIKTKITDRRRAVDRQFNSTLEEFLKNMFVTTMDREHLLIYAKEIGVL